MKPKVITSKDLAKQVVRNEEMGDYKKADLKWYHKELIEKSERKWSPRRALTTLNGFSALAIWLYGMLQSTYSNTLKEYPPPPKDIMLVDYTSVNLLWIYSLLSAHPKFFQGPTWVHLRGFRFVCQVTIITRIVGTAVFVCIVVVEGYEDLYTFSSAATAVAMIGVPTLIYPIPIEDSIDPIDELV